MSGQAIWFEAFRWPPLWGDSRRTPHQPARMHLSRNIQAPRRPLRLPPPAVPPGAAVAQVSVTPQGKPALRFSSDRFDRLVRLREIPAPRRGACEVHSRKQLVGSATGLRLLLQVVGRSTPDALGTDCQLADQSPLTSVASRRSPVLFQ